MPRIAKPVVTVDEILMLRNGKTPVRISQSPSKIIPRLLPARLFVKAIRHPPSIAINNYDTSPIPPAPIFERISWRPRFVPGAKVMEKPRYITQESNFVVVRFCEGSTVWLPLPRGITYLTNQIALFACGFLPSPFWEKGRG